MQDRLVRLDVNRMLQHEDRPVDLAHPFVAPAQGHAGVDVVGHQIEAPLERPQGLAVATQLAQAFPHQKAPAGIAVEQPALVFEGAESVGRHPQLEVAFGLTPNAIDTSTR